MTTSQLAPVRRHPLTAYVVLAIALSWWPLIGYLADPAHEGDPMISIGPVVAAPWSGSEVGAQPGP
jgi:hypothetical protein